MFFSDGGWKVSGKIWLFISLLMLIWLGISPQIQSQAQAQDPLAPLSQGDIDSYIYFLPRLQGEIVTNTLESSAILGFAGINRKRAIFVTTKIAIAQSILAGVLSPSQLETQAVPYRLRPSTEELNLVQKNMVSLVQAQNLALRFKPDLP